MKNKTNTICIRITEEDLKSIKQISIKRSYQDGEIYKYTDLIREAIKEKILNENSQKM